MVRSRTWSADSENYTNEEPVTFHDYSDSWIYIISGYFR